MSGLARVLARREPPGLFRWTARFDAMDLSSTVAAAGWRLAYLDGAYAATKTEVVARLGTVLDFPEHYGANFDALADCLDDLAAATVLLWDDWGPFARTDARAFSVLRRILTARTQEERPGTPEFVVLLRGDGPDLDVPLLD